MHWHAILAALFGGGTWGTGGNLVASVLLAVLGLVTAFLARHKITGRLATLWDRHHGPKAVERHKQALREHEAEKQQRGEGTQ